MTEESEVARIRAQIDAELEAGRQALSGLAFGVAQHRFITARMERLGAQAQELVASLGQETALPLIAEMMEKETDLWNHTP